MRPGGNGGRLAPGPSPTATGTPRPTPLLLDLAALGVVVGLTPLALDLDATPERQPGDTHRRLARDRLHVVAVVVEPTHDADAVDHHGDVVRDDDLDPAHHRESAD